jgi:hypothetical protein
MHRLVDRVGLKFRPASEKVSDRVGGSSPPKEHSELRAGVRLILPPRRETSFAVIEIPNHGFEIARE